MRQLGKKYAAENKPVDAANAFSKCIQEIIKSYEMSNKTTHGRLLEAIASAVNQGI